MTDWTQHLDDISDAISDSMDMDWAANDGARAVVRWLNGHNPLTAAPVRDEGGAVPEGRWVYTSACPKFDGDSERVKSYSGSIHAGWEDAPEFETQNEFYEWAKAECNRRNTYEAKCRSALATREEGPACKKCGGKGYTEYEGGEGEGYPSRPEIEACSCEEAPAAAGEDTELIAALRSMPRCHCAGDDWPSLYDRAADRLEALRTRPQARSGEVQ